MRSTVKRLLSLVMPLVMPLLLAACATGSPSQPLPPVVGPGVKLTPLPASVTEIDLKPSVGWREKVRNYLLKLEAFSINEKPR